MSENKRVSKLRHLNWLAAFKATGVRLAGALALTAFAIYWDSLEPETLSQTDDMAGVDGRENGWGALVECDSIRAKPAN